MKINLKHIFIAIFALFLSYSTVAQQTELWLLNGKKLNIANYKIDTTTIDNGILYYGTLKGKQKKKYLDEVYGVLDKNGSRNIFYKKNPDMGLDLSPVQMKQFLEGMHDSKKLKPNPLVIGGGILAGSAGFLLPQLQVDPSRNGNGLGLYYSWSGEKLSEDEFSIPIGLIVPLGYVATMGAISPSDNEVEAKTQITNAPYIMGYQEGVRKKNIRDGLIGAILGFTATAITIIAIN